MSSAQKTPLGQSLNRFAENKIATAISLMGKSLPCSVIAINGQIVTVKFEVQSGFTFPHVQVPVLTSEYIRLPIQIGCKGIVRPVDSMINNITGLGSASAPDLINPGNLSALIFEPVANANWSTVPSDQTVIYGPNGVILANSNMTVEINLTSTGISITLPSGGNLTVNGGNIVAGSDVTISGKSFLNHTHKGVTIGGSSTGVPN